MINFEEVKKIAKKCIKCTNPSCVKACPLNNPIPEILKSIENDKLDLAKELLFSNTNIPYICSNLCDKEKSCYGSCVLNKKNDPAPFYLVEEYLSSFYDKGLFIKKSSNNKSAIIIGSGVAGINASIKLAVEGFKVTLIEKENRIGGVINNTLPSFRFDDSILNKYEEILSKLEVNVLLNNELFKDVSFDELLKYDVCLFAMGTQVSKMSFKDSDFSYDALEILAAYKNNKKLIENKKVIVTGGGNVAMDVARVLLRCNNDVTICYRRDMKNAPSSKHEINLAKEEGVKFNECISPVSLIMDNELLKGIKFEKMDLVDDPVSSRKTFVKTGKYEDIACDYLVEAIGQNADYNILKSKLHQMFNEDGWPVNEVIKYQNTLFASIGDYNLGASTFAKAQNNSNEMIRKVLERI